MAAPSTGASMANGLLMCSVVPAGVVAGASMQRRRRSMNAVRMCAMADADMRQPLDIEAAVQPHDAAIATGSTTAVADVSPGPTSLTGLKAIPFLPDPTYRRYVRNVPGDAGFDPLRLAGADRETFVTMYESELKHGRIAMLAGVGFAASEILHPRLAAMLGLPNLMAEGGCAPTLLNGGLLNPVLLTSLVAIFGVMSFADISIPKKTGLPGYYGFDPLKLGDVEFSSFAKSLLRGDVEWVAEAEIKHSRVAMLVVVYMAVREFLTQTPTWPSL